MVAVLNHPLYIPDLAPVDFFLFPRLKSTIKGVHFADVSAIKDLVTAVLRSITQEAFADHFRKLYESCRTCVVEYCSILKGNKENLYLLFCLFSDRIHITF